MPEYDGLVIYAALTALLPVLLIVLNALIIPRRRTKVKELAFECGQPPMEWKSASFPVEYFPYALIYIAYAVVAIIAFLSAVSLIDSPQSGVRVIMFLAILSVSAVYMSFQLPRIRQRI